MLQCCKWCSVAASQCVGILLQCHRRSKMLVVCLERHRLLLLLIGNKIRAVRAVRAINSGHFWMASAGGGFYVRVAPCWKHPGRSRSCHKSFNEDHEIVISVLCLAWSARISSKPVAFFFLPFFFFSSRSLPGCCPARLFHDSTIWFDSPSAPALRMSSVCNNMLLLSYFRFDLAPSSGICVECRILFWPLAPSCPIPPTEPHSSSCGARCDLYILPPGTLNCNTCSAAANKWTSIESYPVVIKRKRGSRWEKKKKKKKRIRLWPWRRKFSLPRPLPSVLMSAHPTALLSSI